MKFKAFLKKERFVIFFFILFDFIFFWQFFLKGLIPIPADVIIGGYYPWLNEKWGYISGVPVKNAPMSDVVSLMYPWRREAVGLIKEGQLPLWDSSSFLGTSLIGNFQAGIFNPFNLLYFIPISFNWVWGLQVVIQPLLALVSMYIFLKNWQISKLAAVVGALSYAFSAQLLVWFEYNVLGFSLAVFPLFILTIDKFIQSKNLNYLAGISFLIAFLVFVGYPQYLYYFILFGYLYFLFNSFNTNRIQQFVIDSVIYFFFVLLGVLISSVSLLPGLEVLMNSVKSLDVVAFNNSVLFLPLKNLITLLIPDFFGNPATGNYFGVGSYESFAFYTSIISVCLALVAIKEFRSNKKVVTCLIFLIVSLLLSLRTPFSEQIQNLDWLGLKGSVSSRILFVYGFAISCLAAIGAEILNSEKIYKKKWLDLYYLPVFVIVGICLGNLIFSGNIENLKISIRNTILPVVLVVLTIVIIALSKLIKNKAIVLIILLGLISIDYLRFGWKYLPFTRADLIFPATSTTDFLQKEKLPFRIAVEKGEILPANTWSVYSLENITGYNILLQKSTSDYISYLNRSQISQGYSRFLDITNYNSQLLDLANVKYFVVLDRKNNIPDSKGSPPENLGLKKYKIIFKDGPVSIYENTNYLDRFYTVNKFTITKFGEDAYKIINSGNFNPNDEIVLEEDPAVKVISKCNLSNLNYRSQQTTVETNCIGESLLVFSQPFYPGWEALIDNQPTDIMKANGIFSAIRLPPGNSKVEIKYNPKSFKYGFWISIISTILLLVFIIINFKKNYRINR